MTFWSLIAIEKITLFFLQASQPTHNCAFLVLLSRCCLNWSFPLILNLIFNCCHCQHCWEILLSSSILNLLQFIPFASLMISSQTTLVKQILAPVVVLLLRPDFFICSSLSSCYSKGYFLKGMQEHTVFPTCSQLVPGVPNKALYLIPFFSPSAFYLELFQSALILMDAANIFVLWSDKHLFCLHIFFKVSRKIFVRLAKRCW